MGRPIYPYELNDPDFSWLISNFQENFPKYSFVETSCLPVVFIEDDSNVEHAPINMDDQVPLTEDEKVEDNLDHFGDD
ncbi:hypothetical protein OAO01_04520 [Oligoflexia bacterium]|nr:hypothetical protein [Oligoflexia bacterium]